MKRLCELLEVGRSSYYAWRAGRPKRQRRAAADAALTEQIRAVHETDPAMGAPRITAELNDRLREPSRWVNRKRVARLMRVAGITGYRRECRVRTAVPDQTCVKHPDLVISLGTGPTRSPAAARA